MGLIALSAAIAPVSRAIDNSWTNSASGKWETPANWSLGLAPTNTQSILITNASTKAVTIDATTTNFLATMTVSNLTISAPLGATNTLLLSNAGTNVPLRVLKQCNFSTNASIIVSNSALQVLGVLGTGNGLSIRKATVRIDAEGTLTNNTIMSVGTADAQEGRLLVNGGEARCYQVNVYGNLELRGGNFTTWSMQVKSTNPLAPATLTIVDGQFDSSAELGLANYSSFGQVIVSNGTVNTDLGYYGVGYLGGVGTFTVAGGNVTLRSYLAIAREGATGTVAVTGGRLTVTNDDVIVGGQYSRAVLVVSNGTLHARSVRIQPITQSASSLILADGELALDQDLTMRMYPWSTSTVSVWIAGGRLLVTNGTVGIWMAPPSLMVQSNGTICARSFHVGDVAAFPGGWYTQAGGTNVVSSDLVVGNCGGGGTAVVAVTGGSLYVTNAAHDAVLRVDSGTFTVSGGTLQVDRFVMTNACAQFVRTGGTLIYGTAVLTTNLDADGDGMANGWEQAYGLDPLNAADASADNDGDGFTNLQEFQAGTDPTNSASAFRILSVVSTNDDMLVTWAAGGGRTNIVQSSTDLMGSYTNVSANIILTNVSGDVTTNYLDAGAGTNSAARLYRVRLVP